MRKLLSRYYNLDEANILLTDRAFLGLYAIFQLLKEQTTKRKILFTSSTCPSPVFAAIYAGLEPVFVDVSLDDFLMNSNQAIAVMKSQGEQIAALVYINLFGHSNHDIFALKEITQQQNIVLIEDIAQAFGAMSDGEKLGTIGDVGLLSFGYSKQVDAGNGGALLLNNKGLFKLKDIERIITETKRFDVDQQLNKQYQDHFYSLRKKSLEDPSCYLEYASFPYLYKSLYFKKIQVDWTLVKRKTENFLTQQISKQRNDVGQQYKTDLSDLGDVLFLPEVHDNYSLYRYSLLTENYVMSSALSDYLRKNGIHCSNLYLPVSRFYVASNFNNAQQLALRIINLWVDGVIVNNDYLKKNIHLIKKFYDSA